MLAAYFVSVGNLLILISIVQQLLKNREGEKHMAETNDMKETLMSTPDLDRFLAEHRADFAQESAADYLNLLFNRKNVTKAALAKKACMSEVYLHQVFAGKRNPSRNRIICICFGLGANLEETQEFLKHCGHAQLYAKIERDAIVIYGLANGLDLIEVNDKLFAENEESLY